MVVFILPSDYCSVLCQESDTAQRIHPPFSPERYHCNCQKRFYGGVQILVNQYEVLSLDERPGSRKCETRDPKMEESHRPMYGQLSVYCPNTFKYMKYEIVAICKLLLGNFTGNQLNN